MSALEGIPGPHDCKSWWEHMSVSPLMQKVPAGLRDLFEARLDPAAPPPNARARTHAHTRTRTYARTLARIPPHTCVCMPFCALAHSTAICKLASSWVRSVPGSRSSWMHATCHVVCHASCCMCRCALRFGPETPIELRPVFFQNPLRPQKAEPLQHMWIRANGAGGGVGLVHDDSESQRRSDTADAETAHDSAALHQLLLSYASDYGFLETALHPHEASMWGGKIQAATVDHSMWYSESSESDSVAKPFSLLPPAERPFGLDSPLSECFVQRFHREFRCDEWLLHRCPTPLICSVSFSCVRCAHASGMPMEWNGMEWGYGLWRAFLVAIRAALARMPLPARDMRMPCGMFSFGGLGPAAGYALQRPRMLEDWSWARCSSKTGPSWPQRHKRVLFEGCFPRTRGRGRIVPHRNDPSPSPQLPVTTSAAKCGAAVCC